MPQRFLIIDGYNLLHAAGMARFKYGPGELEKARHRLLNFLANRLSPRECERTTIVFDAGDAPYESPRQSSHEGMTVLFAPAGGDADSLIETLIERHSAPRQVQVVSSDHRLQKAARKRRAKAVDSDVFFADIDARDVRIMRNDELGGRNPVVDPKFSGEVSADETKSMLQIFGEADIADEPAIANADPPSAIEEAPPDDKNVVSDVDDAEWRKYLAEIPDDLNKLLDDDSE